MNIESVLERERSRVIKSVMLTVERFISEDSEEHEAIRRQLMDSTELMNRRVAEALNGNSNGKEVG